MTTIKYFSKHSPHSGLTGCMTIKALQAGVPSFNRAKLLKVKFKAMRSGVWYRALPRIDRVLIDLTIKVTESIRSSSLTRSLLAVVGKLEGLLESSVLKSLKLTGYQLAEKLGLIAQRWGNSSADSWANDSSFAFFLAVMHTNR